MIYTERTIGKKFLTTLIEDNPVSLELQLKLMKALGIVESFHPAPYVRYLCKIKAGREKELDAINSANNISLH